MEIICVNNIVGDEEYININIGKKYTCLSLISLAYGYWIVDDFGNKRCIPNDCFLTIEEWRESQLSKLL